MKTKLFIFLTLLNITLFNVRASIIEIDTSNLIKPEILSPQCGNNPLFGSASLHAQVPFIKENGKEINVYAWAQPFKVDEKTPIKSICIKGGKEQYTPGLDSNLCYFQIWDGTLTTLFYQVRYDTLHQNFNFQTDNGIHPCEIKFDTTIVVEGDFYVVQTTDTVYNRLRCYETGDIFGYFYMTKIFTPYEVCENYEKYPMPKIKLAGTDEWMYPKDMPLSQSTPYYDSSYRKLVAFDVYVRVDTSYVFVEDTIDNVGITNIDKDSKEIIDIFPNPASEELSVQSSFKINDIEVFNPLGQRVFSKKVEGYNTKVNTSTLPKGNYILKINTTNGTTNKKFLVQ
ncbi:MAG: T9SS type A sorting domain-containing protein [Bacteroidota bacterium]|nr:T9SS type A sorting domain-containing protein [Bacteroidota bacterium]